MIVASLALPAWTQGSPQASIGAPRARSTARTNGAHRMCCHAMGAIVPECGRQEAAESSAADLPRKFDKTFST